MPSVEEPLQAELVPELAKRREQFLAIKDCARKLTDPLSNTQFNWKPAPDEWSVGQCLSHLNVSGGLLLRRLEDAVEHGRQNGQYADGPFRYGMMSRWFVRMLGPHPRVPIPTPSSYEPAQQHHREVVAPRFLELQDELVDVVERANGLDLASITVVSPANRIFRFPLGAWLAAVEAHEWRHLTQARDVLDHESFPSG